MKDNKELKQVKEGIINRKIQSKPSFKNLFDISKEKLPIKDRSPRVTNNRSRSISQKKGSSQQKVGTVKVKNNSRLSRISIQKSQTSINMEPEQKSKNKIKQSQLPIKTEYSEYSQQYSQPSIPTKSIYEESKISKYKYETEKSEISGRSSHKKSNHQSRSKSRLSNQQQQIFKMLINMKNQIMKLEKQISAQEEQLKIGMENASGPEASKKSKLPKTTGWQTLEKMKKMQSFLSDYQTEIQSQTSEIGDSYLSKLEQLGNQENYQQIYLEQSLGKVRLETEAGMPQLQKRLSRLSKTLM